jgi:CHAT domain-containing protein
MKRVSLTWISVFIFFHCFCQLSESEFKFLSGYYNKEYKNLINARGIDTNSYFNSKYLSQNDPTKISAILNKYYGNGEEYSIAALVYFYYDSSLFIFLADRYQVVKLGQQKISSKELTGLNDNFIQAMNLQAAMQNRSPINRSSIITKSTHKQLSLDSLTNIASQVLLPGIEKILAYQHLIIVPCFNLGAFPFYLLKVPGTREYLLDKLSYTIAPSLIEVEAGCKRNADRLHAASLGASVKFLAEDPLLISNPHYPRQSSFVFPDLPGADKEVSGSLKFFDKYQYYSADTATKKNVLKRFTQHDLIYFATHGISSSTNPLDSCFLVLAGEQDPFLTNKEILRYRDSSTKMEMVILSACQTGLGRSMDAGIIGLSRAFQIAGANHVVMSLWNVDDEATSFLMRQFIIQMQFSSKYFPAEPLRKAILATKKKFNDPSKWASFSVFGVPY